MVIELEACLHVASMQVTARFARYARTVMLYARCGAGSKRKAGWFNRALQVRAAMECQQLPAPA